MGHSTTGLLVRIDGFNELFVVRFLVLPVGCAHYAAPSNGGTTNNHRVAPMSYRRKRQRGLSAPCYRQLLETFKTRRFRIRIIDLALLQRERKKSYDTRSMYKLCTDMHPRFRLQKVIGIDHLQELNPLHV
jgi:hypothetical protein